MANESMNITSEVRLEIPFHDIDILGIVWHGHYYKYFELARTELYRRCNLDIGRMHALGYIFPVIESHCRYVQPLTYGQRIEAVARLVEYRSYIRIDYTLRDADNDKRMAYGHTKQAVCRQDGTMLLAIPDDIIDLITAA